MENLSQLVTQEDYRGLQVLRITHHCYVSALNTSRSPHKEEPASAVWSAVQKAVAP
jgi:hypothetical protein